MIRKVRIEAGNYSFKVSLDENLYFENRWTRIEGNPSVCPESGIWRYGTAYNSHYLYLIDENDDSILYLIPITIRNCALGQ